MGARFPPFFSPPLHALLSRAFPSLPPPSLFPVTPSSSVPSLSASLPFLFACPYHYPLNPTRGLGSAVSSDSGSGRSPAAKRFWCIFRLKLAHIVHFHNDTFVILLYLLAVYNGDITEFLWGRLGASNESASLKIRRFSLLAFTISSEISQRRPQLLYCKPIYSRLLMTLNGHFTLKSALCSVSNGLACSEIQTKLLGKLQSYKRIYCQRQKCSADALVSGDISFMRLGFPRGSVKQENYIHSLTCAVQLSIKFLVEIGPYWRTKLENTLFSPIHPCLTPRRKEPVRISGWNLSHKN